MPRGVKGSIAPKRGGEVIPMNRANQIKAKATGKKIAQKARTIKHRRSPSELIKGLKIQRDKMVEAFSNRLHHLDSKVAGLEAKHQDRLAIAALVESKTPQELDAEVAAAKAQISLLRKAKKLVNK